MNSSLQNISHYDNRAAGPIEVDAAAPRILIVDDISDNRNILARRFVRNGFDVDEADGGQSALDMIDRQRYDLVLLDVMMPGIDGIEVLKRIRSRFSPVDLPVIMVTAKSQSEDIVSALTLKANDYVTKPVDFPVALARVNVQIERKRAEDGIKAAKEQLEIANELLEARIHERTSTLVEINQRLKGEIEHRQRSEAETRHLALHDALTGLANRLMFREELEKALSNLSSDGDGVAVLFIDLDGFKSVNDTLGHSIGDKLLKQISKDLVASIGERDLVARLGGDEFAILHFGRNLPESSIRVASNAITIASRNRVIEGQLITVGASIGIVTCFNSNEKPEELLKNADLAMYRAKSEGRGTYRIFDPEMDAQAQARRTLEIEMRRAYVNGDFEIYYQPQISLATKRVCGFEALLRWNNSVYGDLPPADFVPVAEDTGLIVQLGDWVLRQACQEAMEWPDSVTIAVNISPVQFSRGNVIESVIGALASSGLPPHRLEIEITESVLLDRTDRNFDTLNQLRSLGVKVAMDDFGTGYSSLSYLRRFRFDKIKIDQSFVKDISKNNESDAIVHAIANLGINFGIATTAEGVETREQLRHLVGEGCSEAQGWVFSKAVTASEVPDLLSEHANEEIEAWSAEMFQYEI